LTSGRRLVAAHVAAEFGVDERTIRRDLLQTLKRDWGLPVLYDRSAKHWRLADGAATASLPQTIVNEGDRLSLLLSLQAAEQYKGTPLYDRLQRIYGRLVTLLPLERRTRSNELASKARFEGLPAPSIHPGIWDVVLLATEAEEY
jgi:predicted DNA-binding transcriptional regulator YafY